jgi:hypothetical protein
MYSCCFGFLLFWLLGSGLLLFIVLAYINRLRSDLYLTINTAARFLLFPWNECLADDVVSFLCTKMQIQENMKTCFNCWRFCAPAFPRNSCYSKLC